MTAPFFVIGAGGFGREVAVLVDAMGARGPGSRFAGFIDDDPSEADRERVARMGARIVGTIATLTGLRRPFSAVIAVGSAGARRNILARLGRARVVFPPLVHPDATVGRDVQLAEGVVVAAGARLSTSVRVGRHAHIDQNAVVAHDCTVGEFSRVSPAACLCGAVTLGSDVLVGAGAVLLPGMAVGDGGVVGAAACVTGPVSAGMTVVGVPARLHDTSGPGSLTAIDAL